MLRGRVYFYLVNSELMALCSSMQCCESSSRAPKPTFDVAGLHTVPAPTPHAPQTALPARLQGRHLGYQSLPQLGVGPQHHGYHGNDKDEEECGCCQGNVEALLEGTSGQI